MELRFAEAQMNGPYKYGLFKKEAGMGRDRASGLAKVRRWEACADGSREPDAASPTSVVFSVAAMDLLTSIQGLMGRELSGLDVEAWAMARHGLIAANRLVTMPDAQMPHGAELPKLIQALAFLVDCMGRISDADERDAFIRDIRGAEITDEYMLKQALPVYADIICGRGGAWLAYVDDMGACALAGSGQSWWKVRDAYGERAVDGLVTALMRVCGVDVQRAQALVAAELSLIGDVYDRWQYTMRKDAVGKPAANEGVEEGTAFGRCRRDGAFPFARDVSMDMFGYCRAFGASPVSCVFDIPRTLEVEVRKARVKKVAKAREEARQKALVGYWRAMGERIDEEIAEQRR